MGIASHANPPIHPCQRQFNTVWHEMESCQVGIPHPIAQELEVPPGGDGSTRLTDTAHVFEKCREAERDPQAMPSTRTRQPSREDDCERSEAPHLVLGPQG